MNQYLSDALYISVMEDTELIRAVKAGETGAFQSLVEQYQDRVINTCYGFVRDREDAKDIAQEVFIEIYQSLEKFREDAKLSTWIYRISVTKSLDFLRRKNRKKRMGQFKKLFNVDDIAERIEQPSGNNPDKNMEARERAQILQQAMDRLPENQKIAITLSKYEGFSNKEISEIMNTSVSSVESLIHRAKVNLKKKLYRYYDKHL
jgi:RNA polymerase sigma-70 factor (ECF subfamily)